ncbi:MAG: class I SAM-dependent methyltransferase [Defluviitaleaceae bacterium]|nr:class I SAM-dependent methyltransferase [Defluviitaleaceae bacterium]
MEIASDWRDYVLLDAGGGEKLEIWGGVTVIRPDPQAFWPRSYKWETPDMHYRRSKSGGGTWEILNEKIPHAWKISYGGMKFHIRPTGFKHMGLFPEQAVNWNWLGGALGALPTSSNGLENSRDVSRINAQKANAFAQKNSPPKILNLFAYTGGATVACLKAGAEVTHVDASKGMNNQARENIALSGLSGAKFRVLTDDVLKFVQREARRGNMYDGIIMDPPVFGRGPSGEMWRLEEGLFELVEACVGLLSESALFFLINAYTAGFSPTVFGNILNVTTKKANLDGDVSVGEIGLAAKSGIILPCGMYAKWAASGLRSTPNTIRQPFPKGSRGERNPSRTR